MILTFLMTVGLIIALACLAALILPAGSPQQAGKSSSSRKDEGERRSEDFLDQYIDPKNNMLLGNIHHEQD